MELFLSPPIAFIIYIPLVLVLVLFGRSMAGPVEDKENVLKRSVYGSGEEAPIQAASPGYRPFFLVAFFFAILHLGMLVLGTGSFSFSLIPYLIGLVLALVALILG